MPLRARRLRLRPAPGLRRRDHRRVSLEAAGRDQALRVGGGRRHLHSAEHDPSALQWRSAAARAADLVHQPHLQEFRVEQSRADRGRARIRSERRADRRAGETLSDGAGQTAGLSARLMHTIKESDWKLFKPLRAVALARYCEIFQLLQKRDHELQQTFDYLRRSTALNQLVAFRVTELVTDEEFLPFSAEVREFIQSV